jgi:hypothetical protein
VYGFNGFTLVCLTARSPVFLKMFQNNNWTESKDGVLKADDIGGDAMDRLLKFIYLGFIDMTGCEAQTIVELVDASEKVTN